MDEKKEEKKIGNKDVVKKAMDPKKKKIITFSIIGGAALIVFIILIALILSMAGKPSKSKSEELVKSYLKAINDSDEDKFGDLIDTKGYIIFNEEGEKKFDRKYKEKDTYIKKYLDDKNYDDISDAEDYILSQVSSKYSYSYKEYSLKEIASVEKSSKSSKIKEIKAKVKVKSSYSTSSDTKTLKLYVIKVDGKYKVVGSELK